MKENIIINFETFDLPEEIINEIIILHNIGVNIEDLKYILNLKLNNLI